MPRRTAPPNASSETLFELGSLFEFSNVVNGTLDLKFILNHFLLTLMGKLLSFRGIVLFARTGSLYSVENVRGLPDQLIGTAVTIPGMPKRLIVISPQTLARYPWLKFFDENGIRLVAPLLVQEKVVGVAGFSPVRMKKKLSEKESTYVRSLANIAATAIEKGLILDRMNQLNRQLDGKIQELNTLFELSKEFNAVLDQDRLMRLLMFSIMGQIGVNRFAILLQTTDRMEVVVSRFEQSIPEDLTSFFPTVGAPVVVDAMTKKNDRRWRTKLQDLGIRVLVPLQILQKTKGILALGEKMHGGAYTKTDLDFLFSLGNLAIISLENARLFKETIEKQRLEDELQIAKEIQRGLLPKQLPSIHGLELSAVNISSKQVGGDYYDVIPLFPGRYVIAIGDVSGKGTPASLLMANLQATIRALVPLNLSLADLTKRVNDLVCENTGLDRFITFFWGIFDESTKIFRYVNAGHNPPFLIRSTGTVERLDKGGIILGIMKALVPYQEGEVVLSGGDVLVLFTDGVSESMNSSGEEWGEEKMEEILLSRNGDTAETILSTVVDAVKEHSRDTAQYDDITLVVLKVVA